MCKLIHLGYGQSRFKHMVLFLYFWSTSVFMLTMWEFSSPFLFRSHNCLRKSLQLFKLSLFIFILYLSLQFVSFVPFILYLLSIAYNYPSSPPQRKRKDSQLQHSLFSLLFKNVWVP